MCKLSRFLLVFILFAACRRGEQPVFRPVSAKESGLDFINETFKSDSISVLEFEYMFNGGGTSLLDFDNDGWLDVFFTSNVSSCRLFRNVSAKAGKLKFEDVTEKSGITTNRWCYGSSVVDINQDGHKDIFVSVAGHRKTPKNAMVSYFFINQGDGTFKEKAAEMGLAETGYATQAVFFDADGDLDLDLYLLRNSFVSYNRNQIRKKEIDGLAESNDKLYRNEGADAAGNVHFTEMSKEANILIEGFGLGVSACDLDENGKADIYATNDFLTNDLLWENQGGGRFENRAPRYLKHQTYNAMGHDIADFNNDGLMDIVAVDMLPPDNRRWKLTIMGNRFDEHYQSLEKKYEPQFIRNTLQLNTGFDQEGKPTFSEIGQMAGIHATEWSWSPLFADFDNDGWKDLFISNGYRQDVTNLDFIVYGKAAMFMGTPEANRLERIKELESLPGIQVPNVIYRNKRDLTFEDVSKKWGIGSEKTYSNGAVYGDLDNDGDLDLVVNNLDQPASLFENTTAGKPKSQEQRGWLRLAFRGEKPNLDGFGAKVWLWQNGQMQRQDYAPVRGYLSTCEPFLHFGLEKSDGPIDSLRVRWADGREQFFTSLKTGQVLVVEQKNAVRPNTESSRKPSDIVFNEISTQNGLNFKHEEDDYIDFKTQALLPHLHSRFGPFIATGDLNGDKLEDAVVGAAAGFSKKIFFQKADGTFQSTDFPEKNIADDGGLLLFDADGDADLDLFVAAGGAAEARNGTDFYQSKLYENDGKGNFSQKTSALPTMNTAAACPVACDFDKDGDTDLFVGGRVSPNEYPSPPRSFLLKNDGKGNFVDATPEALKYSGMICAAVWADFDGDGWPDLALAGEYTPIQIVANGVLRGVDEGKGKSNGQPIHHSFGWWNALTAADFDGDGDMDLVAGNRGTNGFFKASPEEPVRVFASDFDKNGLIDPVMTAFWGGVEQIAHTRDDVNKQITPFRARFRTYTEFADKTFAQSFRKDEIAAAQVLRAETFGSAFLENKGNGQFELKNLPNEAQMSTICAFQVEDFNTDGKPDLLCVGNNFSTEVQSGRYDAQGSFVLMNTGNGQFSWHRQMIYADGDCKSVARLRAADGSALFLIGRNRDRLLAFRK
jgi:enediyne biosynthesis protein E4